VRAGRKKTRKRVIKVSGKAGTSIHRMLQESSEKTKDAAAREIVVLKDGRAVEIASKCGCTVHDVYREALKEGIYPYRYLRNRDCISMDEQLVLSRSRVAVVGAGGLGGHVIMLLTRVGIGQLVVIDHDVFDETNLNRQVLCTEEALGKSKAEEAVLAVGSINPGVKVMPYKVKLDSSNATEILAGSDVVVDALDNVPDRFVLENAAKKLAIPLVHGALAGFEGRVMTIFPNDTGLKQLYGTKGSGGDKSKSPEAILGVPTVTPSLIATLQAMEVLKIILNRGKIYRNVMVHVDLETGEVNKFCFDGNS
jgi:molybdopterin/thiamine biosynthesis adenylyltransferase